MPPIAIQIQRFFSSKESLDKLWAFFFPATCLTYIIFTVYLVIYELAFDQHVVPPENIAKYGVDQVSGYYGPGSWAAWLLVLAACCLERVFPPKATSRTPAKPLHVWGLNFDLLAAYGYPLVAAFDLIIRLHALRRNDHTTDGIASMAAAHTVVMLGMGLTCILSFLSFDDWVEEKSDAYLATSCCLVTVFLTCTIAAFDMALLGMTYKQCLLQPFYLNLGPPHERAESRLRRMIELSKLLNYPTTYGPFDSYILGNHIMDIFLYPISIICAFLAAHTWQRYLPRVPGVQALAYIVAVLVIQLVSWFSILMSSYTVVFLVFEIWFSSGKPVTMASVLDLDQMSVLLLSGALIFANTGVGVFLGHKVRLVTSLKAIFMFFKGLIPPFLVPRSSAG